MSKLQSCCSATVSASLSSAGKLSISLEVRASRMTSTCYERTAENLERLATALGELKPKLRGVPPGLPFILDARSLALGANFTFDTQFGDLDLLGHVEPIGDYACLDKRATTYRVADLELRVIDLDDLIRIKRHINRLKDRESLFQLLAIKKTREETGAD